MSEPLDPARLEADLLTYLRREVFAPDIALDAQTNLIAAGFDSMNLVRLLLFIEQTYACLIPEGELTNTDLLHVRSIAATIVRFQHEQ